MDEPYLVNCHRCGLQKKRASRNRFVCDSCKKRDKNGYPRIFYYNRLIVLKRDCHECQCCGSKSKLLVHHIDCIKRNNSPSNLITLCNSCHSHLHHWFGKRRLRESNIYKLFPKIIIKDGEKIIFRKPKPKLKQYQNTKKQMRVNTFKNIPRTPPPRPQ